MDENPKFKFNKENKQITISIDEQPLVPFPGKLEDLCNSNSPYLHIEPLRNIFQIVSQHPNNN